MNYLEAVEEAQRKDNALKKQVVILLNMLDTLTSVFSSELTKQVAEVKRLVRYKEIQ